MAEEIELKEVIARVHEALEGRDNIDGYDLFYIEAFLCELQQLQEKTRWIPIEKKLPEVRDTPYCIAIKWEDFVYQEERVGAMYIYTEEDIDYISVACKYWKEIE